MPDIRIMSWNLRTLAKKKGTIAKSKPLDKSKIIKFVCETIQRLDADIVGIMEIQGGMGCAFADWMAKKMNGNKPADNWQYRVSCRQEGGTREEYIFLWRQQANRLVLGGSPGPTLLSGIVDDNALETFLQPFGWTKAQKDQLYKALQENDYIEKPKFKVGSKMRVSKSWRVVPDSWEALNGMGAAAVVTFAPAPKTQPPAALTAAQRQQLARVLLTADILRYVTLADRAPYLASFRVGNPPSPLTVVLMHALGPGEPTRLSAINIVAQIAPVGDPAGNPNLVLMGDFNVDVTDMGQTGEAYGRFDDNGTYVFGKLVPTVHEQVFSTLTPPATPKLAALTLTPTDKTSLLNTYLADSVGVNDILLNTYDKFLHRGVAASKTDSVNMPQRTASNQAPLVYDSALARWLMLFFRSYRGAASLKKQLPDLVKKRDASIAKVNKRQKQLDATMAAIKAAKSSGPLAKGDPLLKRKMKHENKLKLETKKRDNLSSQVTNLEALIALVDNSAVTAPTGMGTAASVYRNAVSDHLPIMTTLTFP